MEFVKNQTFYHIQRIPTWNIGQTYFIGREKNNYCKYFDLYAHNFEDKKTGKPFHPNLIADSMLEYLETGKKNPEIEPYFSFDPCETIRLLRDIIWNYSRYLRESIFEEVRQEFFPSYPSRQKGAWVISKKEHIPYWFKTLGATKDSAVFEVELSGKIHEANHSHIKLTTNSFNGIRQQAFNYWIAEKGLHENIGDECVFVGFLTVKKSISIEELNT